MNLLDKLLSYYNINEKEYKELTLDVNEGSVPFFKVFNNINKATERILKAIANKEKIIIYGDYDADGILATSILVNTFKSLNYPVDYYIPSRYIDGYGLSKEKVLKSKDKGYKLIITVDNGIKANEAIDAANGLGIDVIVTDHHEYDVAPNCYTYLHPKNSSFSVQTSGAVVAFYLSYALLQEIKPYYLALAGTSLLSDAMPLRNENRKILRLAIKYLNKHKFDKFNLLSEVFIYDENVLSMNVIPKINAVGRVEENKEVNILVKYFTTDSYRDLINIRNYLNATNEKRKTLTSSASDIKVDIAEASICERLDIISGMSGLIANKLMLTYNKPAIIFSKEIKNGTIRASIRSKNGLNVIDFINNNNKELFIEQGGHALAAGIVIKEENFKILKDKFNEYAKAHPFKEMSEGIYISLDDLTIDNYYLIRSFAPFGEEWKEPNFILKDIDVSSIRRMGKNSEHLLININSDAKIVGFNFDFTKLENKTTIDLIGNYRLNNYKNHISLNFTLKK